MLRNSITHFDSIGIQFHSFFAQELEEKAVSGRYNPDWLFGLMDLYARFNIAEQITEMTIPSYSNNEEDEQVQAELLTALYRTFFSHPAMEAIIYWNVIDGYAHVWSQEPEAIRASQGDMTMGENKYYHSVVIRFSPT